MNTKKLLYLIGAFTTAAAIFVAIAVLLKKLKVSLSIESMDDSLDEAEKDDIDVVIENAADKAKEAAEAVEDSLDEIADLTEDEAEAFEKGMKEDLGRDED